MDFRFKVRENLPQPLISLVATVIILLISLETSRAADQWTNLTGTSTVTGEMLGMWNGRVFLKLEGGRRVSVKMSDLRADSRIQAEKRFEKLQEKERQGGFREKPSANRPFFFKGEVGRWKNELTQEQIDKIIQSNEPMMRHFGYL